MKSDALTFSAVTYCKPRAGRALLYPVRLVRNRQKASQLHESTPVNTFMSFFFCFVLLAAFQMNCKTTECTDFCINIIIIEHVIIFLFFNKMSGQTESHSLFGIIS